MKKAELTGHLDQILDKIEQERSQASSEETSQILLEEISPLAQMSFVSALCMRRQVG